MYSKKLAFFIEKHRPIEIPWSAEKIQALAEKAGLGFDEKRVFSKEYPAVSLELPIKVFWEERIENNFIIFSPNLKCRSGFFKGETDLRKELLSVSGLKSVEVELPERLVVLPRAPWDFTRSITWDGIVEDTLICFQSESVEIVSSFCKELYRLMGGGG